MSIARPRLNEYHPLRKEDWERGKFGFVRTHACIIKPLVPSSQSTARYIEEVGFEILEPSISIPHPDLLAIGTRALAW